MDMIRKLIYLGFALLLPMQLFASESQDGSTKKERNYIREGNKMYAAKRYGDAETLYQKALAENEFSPIAKFNLATTYLRQTSTTDTTKNGLLDKSIKMLQEVTQTSNNQLASKAYYDLGNISYNQKDYAKSIELYKNALRKNPDDDKARENLRLAQKQLKNQQNNNQDNKDQDNKQNQKQNQDQNKEKNKNGENQDKQDQNPQKQPQQPPKGGMSKENAEQILQTMQNEEKNTQDKVNKAKMQQMKGGRRTGKQW